MKTLNMVIGILFIIVTTNCIGMDKEIDEHNEVQPSLDKKIEKVWSIEEIQKLAHSDYKNTKVEILQQPIRLDKLAKIVLSFINGEESPSYVIIGIAEESYCFRKMLEAEFNKQELHEDGIYMITEDEYYQLIDNKPSKLSLKITKENDKLRSKLNNLQNEEFIFYTEAENLFNEINLKAKDDKHQNLSTYFVYGIMPKVKFDKKKAENKNFKNGIYRITNSNSAKYLQVINNKIVSELTLNLSSNKNSSKKESFLLKKLANTVNGAQLTFHDCKDLFNGIKKQGKPINTNSLRPIPNPIVVNIDSDNDKKRVIFKDKEAYIKALKKYIKNNTDPKIESPFREIKDEFTQEEGIIILEIKPYESSLVQHKITGEFYGRNNDGLNLMEKSHIENILLKRYYNQVKNNPPIYDTKVTVSVSQLKLKELFDYIYSENMIEFQNLLKQIPTLKLMMDPDGNNALMVAAHEGKDAFVEFLLEDNSTIKVNHYHINSNYENALLIAARKNHLNIVKRLLKTYPELIQEVDGSGNNIFLISCTHNSLEVVEYLLKDFVFQNKEKNRLTEANLRKGLAIIEEAVKSFKDSPKKSKYSLNYYIKIKDLIKDYLNGSCSSENSSIFATNFIDTEQSKKATTSLISKGVLNISKLPVSNLTVDDIKQLLFEASKEDNIDKVKKLLNQDSSLIKQTDNFGDNIFLIACKNNSWNLVTYLLKEFFPKAGAGNKLTRDDLKKGIEIIDPSIKIKSDSTTNELIEQIKLSIKLCKYFHEW